MAKSNPSSFEPEYAPDPKPVMHYVIGLAIIVLISCIWDVVIPGLAARFDGVFYGKDIELKLPSHAPIPLAKLAEYRKARQYYEQSISSLDLQIDVLLKNGNNDNSLESILKLRDVYKAEFANLREPVTVNPFYGSRTNYYFLGATVFLAILIVFLKPPISSPTLSKQLVIVSVFLYIGWMSTNWLRNFVFYNEGRTIFSFVHYDISPISFILQELRALSMCSLIGILWLQWSLFHTKITQTFHCHSEDPSELNLQALYLRRLFSRWQLVCLAVIGAFFPWTFFYWINAIQYNDNRYFVSAVISHLYWAISLGLVSAPLFYAYNNWFTARSKTLASLTSKSDGGQAVEKASAFIKDLDPLSNIQLFSIGIASVGSFLFPLIDVFRRL